MELVSLSIWYLTISEDIFWGEGGMHVTNHPKMHRTAFQYKIAQTAAVASLRNPVQTEAGYHVGRPTQTAMLKGPSSK